jgi:hypothetical protein
MKRLIPLFAAAGGLLLGGLVGWMLGGSAPAVPVPDAFVEPELPRPVVQPAPARIEEAGAYNSRLAREAPVASSVPTSVPASETGEIWGTVLREDAEPLAGVSIRATPHIPRREAADLSLEEEIAEYAASLARQEAQSVTTRTDAAGRYRLSGLDAGLFYTLEASLPGHVVQQAHRGGSPIIYHAVGKELHFIAKVALVVRLDLRLPDGSRPERAQIGIQRDVEGSGSTSFWYWSPAQPTRSFEPGDWRLLIRGGVHNEYTCEPVSIRVSTSEPPEDRTIQLHAVPTIHATVTVPQGIEGIRPTLEFQREIDGAFTRVEFPDHRRNPETISPFRGTGRVEYHDLEPGNYRLILALDGKELETRDLRVERGVRLEDFTVPEPDPSDYLIVHVNGPAGPVTTGVQFHFTTEGRLGSSSGRVQALNRGNGLYWIPRTLIPESEGATYTLLVTAHELGKSNVQFSPRSIAPIHVSLGVATYLIVEILGFDDHPNKHELVSHVWKAGSSPPRPSLMDRIRSGRDETEFRVRRFNQLEPGEYEIGLFMVSRQQVHGLLVARKTVHLASGENRETIHAPELHGFVVVIGQQYRHRQIRVHHADDPGYRFFQNAGTLGAAEYALDRLKPGNYVVSAFEIGEMTVSIPAMSGRRVEFQPLPFNAFRITAAAGGTVDVGLKADDILVAIDGVAIESQAQGMQLIEQCYARDSTTWTVLRDGLRVPVTFKGSSFSHAGLSLSPTRVD